MQQVDKNIQSLLRPDEQVMNSDELFRGIFEMEVHNMAIQEENFYVLVVHDISEVIQS